MFSYINFSVVQKSCFGYEVTAAVSSHFVDGCNLFGEKGNVHFMQLFCITSKINFWKTPADTDRKCASKKHKEANWGITADGICVHVVRVLTAWLSAPQVVIW